MILKIFVCPNCPNCPPAKELGKQLSKGAIKKLRVEFFDTSEVDGMAEAAFYQVMSTPTMLLLDDQEKIVGEWRGKTPQKSEIINMLKRNKV